MRPYDVHDGISGYSWLQLQGDGTEKRPRSQEANNQKQLQDPKPRKQDAPITATRKWINGNRTTESADNHPAEIVRPVYRTCWEPFLSLGLWCNLCSENSPQAAVGVCQQLAWSTKLRCPLGTRDSPTISWNNKGLTCSYATDTSTRPTAHRKA